MATVKKPAKKMQMMGGGTMAKNGKKFDLNKDGKTTFKDVLIGRGVLPKNTAKKGTKVEKAENGIATPSLRRGQMKRLGRISAKNPARADRVANRMIERDTRTERGEMFVNKKLSAERAKANAPKPLKSGGKMTKCKYGCK